MPERAMGIPNSAGWKEYPLGEVCETLTRGTAPVYVEHSSVMAIGQRCVQNAGFDESQARPHDSRMVSRVLWARAGDVLLNSTGTGTIGRSCIFDHTGSFIVDSHVTVLRARPSALDPRWLNNVLRSLWGQRHLETHCYTGSTNQVELSRNELAQSSIPIPPLEEQRRIAEILDVLDSYMSSLHSIVEKRLTTRGAILGELLAKYCVERIRLGDLGTIGSGVTPERGRPEYWNDPSVPWVKTGEVAFSEITRTSESITAAAMRDHRLRVYPAGTVLVAMYGEGVTRGRSAILGVPATINQACAAIVPNSAMVKPVYLFECLRYLYEEMRTLGHGSNQTNLNAQLLAELKVPMTSLDNQKDLISFMADFDCETNLAEAALNKAGLMKQGLAEDLLTGRVRVPEAEEMVTGL